MNYTDWINYVKSSATSLSERLKNNYLATQTTLQSILHKLLVLCSIREKYLPPSNILTCTLTSAEGASVELKVWTNTKYDLPNEPHSIEEAIEAGKLLSNVEFTGKMVEAMDSIGGRRYRGPVKIHDEIIEELRKAVATRYRPNITVTPYVPSSSKNGEDKKEI